MSFELPVTNIEENLQETEALRPDVNALASRAGGHFRLCSIVMKRARELTAGSSRLITCRSKRHINVALKEYEEDKITLLTVQEAKRRLLGVDETKTEGEEE